MKLTYIFHSGFAIEGNGYIILIDYYRDITKKYIREYFLKYPGRLYVLASHSHGDHFNAEILNWRRERPDIQYILSDDIRQECNIVSTDKVVFLRKSEHWNDSQVNIKAFGSTDIGISFLIHAGNISVFHAGDLNNWHWDEESTPEEIKESETHFLEELEDIAQETGYIDLVLFPVDPRLGKNYMKGAQQFINRIKTRQFAPMHFWKRYEAAAAFKAYAENNGCKFITWREPLESVEI